MVPVILPPQRMTPHPEHPPRSNHSAPFSLDPSEWKAREPALHERTHHHRRLGRRHRIVCRRCSTACSSWPARASASARSASRSSTCRPATSRRRTTRHRRARRSSTPCWTATARSCSRTRRGCRSTPGTSCASPPSGRGGWRPARAARA